MTNSSPARSQVSRITRGVVVALLFGITATYLSAWTFVVLAARRTQPAEWLADPEGGWTGVLRTPSFGATTSECWLTALDPNQGVVLDSIESVLKSTRPAYLPSRAPKDAAQLRSWIRAAEPNGPYHIQLTDSLSGELYLIDAGWPFASLTGWETQTAGPMFSSVRTGFGVFLVPPPLLARLPAGAHAALPATPIWPNFLLSLFLYAGLFWLCTRSVAALRRAYRRRRGHLCRHCGYDLRGLSSSTPCPECGQLLTETTVARNAHGAR